MAGKLGMDRQLINYEIVNPYEVGSSIKQIGFENLVNKIDIGNKTVLSYKSQFQSQLRDIIEQLWSVLYFFGKSDPNSEIPRIDERCLNGEIDDGRKIRIQMFFYGFSYEKDSLEIAEVKHLNFDKIFTLKRNK